MRRHMEERNSLDYLEKTISDYKKAEVTKEERKNLFKETMSEVLLGSEVMILENNLEDIGFFDAPASIRRHGNYDGGLFDHSLCVTKRLVDMTKKMGLRWELERSPYMVGMFHDLCKAGNYTRKEDGTWTYNEKGIAIPGHGEKSVMMIQTMKHLTEEEILCIRWHMGAFDDSKNWRYYTNAVKRCPNILWTHVADMETSHIIGV